MCGSRSNLMVLAGLSIVIIWEILIIFFVVLPAPSFQIVVLSAAPILIHYFVIVRIGVVHLIARHLTVFLTDLLYLLVDICKI